MTWILLLALVLGLTAALLALRSRRADLERLAHGVEEMRHARARGSDRARLEYPHIDVSRCIGCGLCVSACPEDGVLDVIHGQAVVVHGARCVGHGRCAEACPVGAIALTLGDVSERRDLPALDEALEVPGRPGVFLAGEVTGRALVRTAITHGSAVAREVARRRGTNGHHGANGALDLCIVGAGPAGIGCALEAKKQGLDFVVLERDALGGSVAHYPRRKLVMTQPVDLPLHGRMDRTSYSKEELIELWERVAREHELPIETGREFLGLEQDEDGSYTVSTSGGPLRARNVCIALGRRGTPRRLGVPGEELTKVAYGLEDARAHAGRRALIVGGGDSAIEAALGLCEQEGAEVTLSYRGNAFNRLKARNESRVTDAIASGRIRALYESRVRRIDPGAVEIDVGPDGDAELVHLPNDDVFVFAGGVPPFALLEKCGVSFDPADRPKAEALVEQGSGLGRALTVALGVALIALGWVILRREYYGTPLAQRVDSTWHALLRPAGAIGLAFGIAALLAMLANLLYLARRSPRMRFELGSLRSWMTAHVATGFLALVCALPHAGMAPRDSVGGHALIGLCALVATGAIGRYLYAFVPRAANGRELALDEARSRLEALSAEWERDGRPFAARVRARVDELVNARAWQRSFRQRVLALFSGERRLRRALAELRAEGRREGIPASELAELSSHARRAHRAALSAVHLEDLRGLLATWRYFHRWVALLVVLLVVVHVASALRFADLGRAMKLRDPRVRLALVSAVLVVLLVVLDLERAAPGELSPPHAAVNELAGAAGCAACHGEIGAELADGCLTCHAEIGRDIASRRALHGALDAEAARRCEECHVEHHGSELALVAARSFANAGFAERADFDHPGLAFALAGRHAELACVECHELADALHLKPGEHRFRGLAQRCEACHDDPHEGRLGTGCAECHGQERPFAELAAFAHPASFALRGAHVRAACVDCHAQGGELAIATLTGAASAPARSCADCHASPHSERFIARLGSELALAAGATCTACHADEDQGLRVESVERARALHGEGGFELRAPHDALACAECHPTGSSAPAPDAPERAAEDCAACHADPHAGEFGPGASARGGCLACHAHEEFTPSRFGLEQHAAIGFPLEASHARADCAACHAELSEPGGSTPRFTGLARDCASCHADVHAGAFAGRGCAECHTTERFAAPIANAFEHERATGFALDGAHARAACEACHRRAEQPDSLGRRFGRVAELFGEPARDCATCHADAHGGAFDRAELAQLVDGRAGCARCHSSESFAAYPHGDFDHAQWTGFALEGAHAAADCSKCHPSAAQADASGRRFGRAAEHFPAPRAGCAGCHADPHDGRFARAGATDCASCHSQSSFRVDELDAFDHAQWTGFALEGAHGRADCAACHAHGAADERALGKVAGSRCADCHADPHLGQFARGGATDCARCHASLERFTADGFDHTRDARFALDEKHARLACGACHKAWELADGRSAVRYKPLGRECADCHGGSGR